MPLIYSFDTNSLRVFSNYYPRIFPTFWENLDELVRSGRATSVSEVRKELEYQNASEHLNEWVEANSDFFVTPSEDELAFVAEIFTVKHFQQLIGEKQRLRGYPVADPFLIARGKVHGTIVVTEEVMKPNGAKVPNVCEHFGIDWTNAEGFLKGEGWQF